jgi:hypothetical protein
MPLQAPLSPPLACTRHHDAPHMRTTTAHMLQHPCCMPHVCSTAPGDNLQIGKALHTRCCYCHTPLLLLLHCGKWPQPMQRHFPTSDQTTHSQQASPCCTASVPSTHPNLLHIRRALLAQHSQQHTLQKLPGAGEAVPHPTTLLKHRHTTAHTSPTPSEHTHAPYARPTTCQSAAVPASCCYCQTHHHCPSCLLHSSRASAPPSCKQTSATQGNLAAAPGPLCCLLLKAPHPCRRPAHVLLLPSAPPLPPSPT